MYMYPIPIPMISLGLTDHISVENDPLLVII